MQHWRARSDAIVTGVGTVLADDPALTVREDRFAAQGLIRQPLVAIADSRGRTPANARVFRAERAVYTFGAAAGGSRADLDTLLAELAAEGCNEVLVEAGATLAGAFLRQALWDEAIVYLAPKLLGDEARPLAHLAIERLGCAVAAEVADIARMGNDVRVVLRPLGGAS